MRPWKLVCTGLALAGLAPAALAQGLPAITPPPGVAIAPQPPPVNAPVPPAAQPPNIWDKIVPRADQCAACKAKLCNCALGKMLNNMLQPAGALTGGMVGPFCPSISAADLAKPADSPAGAAARLKLDEADAAARRADVRYMAGADCRYWPEVTDALIGALRADRNECVRLEAALALGRGCCCSRATMLALTLTVSGSTADGNPAEDSERVKAAALAALNHCLENYTEVVPAPEAPPPIKTGEPIKEPIPPKGEPIPPKGEPLPPPTPNPTGASPQAPGVPNRLPAALNRPTGPAEFYHHPENLQEKSVVAAARRATAHVAPAAAPKAPDVAADHSLFGIVRTAAFAPAAPAAQASVAAKPAAHGPVVPASATRPAASSSGVSPAGYSASTSKMPDALAGGALSAPAARIPAFLPPIPPPGVEPGAAPALTNPAAVNRAVSVLRDSIYPEERETAADGLGRCEGLANPDVVQALVSAAKSDAAPIVRAACLRSLMRLNVRTLPVAAAAQALKTDPDPRVRTEAEEALQKLESDSGQQ